MTDVTLIKRKCNECNHESVPLEGIGTACVECETGEYVERTGTLTVSTSPITAAGFSREHPEAVED